ncbi:unnamed protein product [Caenorhabditis brenneri]
MIVDEADEPTLYYNFESAMAKFLAKCVEDQRNRDGSNSGEERAEPPEQHTIHPRKSGASPQKSNFSVARKAFEKSSESSKVSANKTPIASHDVVSARNIRIQKRSHPNSEHLETDALSKATTGKKPSTSSTSPESVETSTGTVFCPKRSRVSRMVPSEAINTSRRPDSASTTLQPVSSEIPQVEDSPLPARPRRSCVKISTFPDPKTPTPLEIIKEIISELPPPIPRGHIIPTGLQRVSFHLTPLLRKHETIPNRLPRSVKHIKAVLELLKIQESPGFPVAVEPAEIFKKGDSNVQKKVSATNKRYPNGVGRILEGEEYQVKVDEEPSELLPETGEDRDEVVWSSDDVEAHFEKDEEKMNEFYKTVDEQYLFSIWRQFESHIQPEVALQHLHQNKFDIPMSLHTIDQRLKDLPQKMKTPCRAQAQMMKKYMFDGLKSMRWIQEMGMRNYHLGELITFKWNLERFFPDDGGMRPVACNCLEPKCRPLNFEPRYGCSNCVKGLKRLSPDKLCLICQTFQNLTGERRSTRSVMFDEDEKQKIRLWTKKERELNRSVSREEFENLLKTEASQRHLKLQLTREEALMLNFDLLKLEDLGEQVADQLQPYTLPHLPQCQCQKSGSIPRLAPNFEKFSFTSEETELFSKTLIANKGNISETATKLGVEMELVERFLVFGSSRKSRFWMKNKQLQSYAKFPPRQILPPINAPESIPDLE